MKFSALFAMSAASTDLLADLLTLTKDMSTKVNAIKDENLRETAKNWITDGFLLYSDRESSSIKEIKSAISGKNSSSLIFFMKNLLSFRIRDFNLSSFLRIHYENFIFRRTKVTTTVAFGFRG